MRRWRTASAGAVLEAEGCVLVWAKVSGQAQAKRRVV